MKDRDWRIFREDFSIQARGGSIPLPLRTWRESNIPPTVLDVIDEVGYTEPSPIQRQAIPIGMQNRDLIGIAKTGQYSSEDRTSSKSDNIGSGKTAAFVVPMLSYINHLGQLTDENRHLGPYSLILAPTRELAQQIESETAKFANRMGYTCVSIIGGRSVEEQQFALRNGAEIIIATPGRLKDMIDKSMIVLSQCRYVVMDEADRMVDLGFEHDLNFILDAMPATLAKPEDVDAVVEEFKGWRVTTLFSATMPPAVERLARKYLRKPATVTIGTAGEAVDTVEQRVEFIEGEEKKKARLIEILRTIGLPPPMIVFVNQKRTADVVVKYVHQAGLSATTLHSDKSQVQREQALQELRDGTVKVLVATDIAGRGIDVPDGKFPLKSPWFCICKFIADVLSVSRVQLSNGGYHRAMGTSCWSNRSSRKDRSRYNFPQQQRRRGHVRPETRNRQVSTVNHEPRACQTRGGQAEDYKRDEAQARRGGIRRLAGYSLEGAKGWIWVMDDKIIHIQRSVFTTETCISRLSRKIAPYSSAKRDV